MLKLMTISITSVQQQPKKKKKDNGFKPVKNPLINHFIFNERYL